MRRGLAILACCFFLSPATRGGDPFLPDGTPLSGNGGLIFLRQGDQTTLSLGGVLLPRKVRVTTATPEGPVVTRFTLPSVLHSPTMPPFLGTAPAFLRVDIPDRYGLLYLDGELLRTPGAERLLQSPPLPPGQAYPVHLRAVFQVGGDLLIEDKQVLLRAGESVVVTFDGSRATSVPLPREGKPGAFSR
jgi:uncharacterized protein (TIGR03000 family)